MEEEHTDQPESVNKENRKTSLEQQTYDTVGQGPRQDHSDSMHLEHPEVLAPEYRSNDENPERYLPANNSDTMQQESQENSKSSPVRQNADLARQSTSPGTKVHPLIDTYQEMEHLQQGIGQHRGYRNIRHHYGQEDGQDEHYGDDEDYLDEGQEEYEEEAYGEAYDEVQEGQANDENYQVVREGEESMRDDQGYDPSSSSGYKVRRAKQEDSQENDTQDATDKAEGDEAPNADEAGSRSSSKSARSRSRSRSRSPKGRHQRSQERSNERSDGSVDRKTKFYVGRIHTDTREEDLRTSFEQFGEIFEVKIIKKSYNGQPLRDTYFAFVVIWLDIDAQEVIDYFEHSDKERGWKVSLAKKENGRDESPRRRRIGEGIQEGPRMQVGGMMGRGRYDQYDRRTITQGIDGRGRYINYRDRRDDYDYRMDRRDDYRERGNRYDNSRDRDDGDQYQGMRDSLPREQRDHMEELRQQRMLYERRYPEPESRIPCNSSSLRQPESFARMLLLPSDVIQNVVLQLANNNKQALVAHNIRVREIWIGNLPNDITDKSLRATFDIYGTVDKIEIFTKPNQIFAFLRYEKVSHASKAFENVDSLGLQLRAGLKISFSDYLKRNNIVGDSCEIEEQKDEMIPFIFICYSNGVNLPKESFLHEKLCEYGNIVSVLMRPSYNSNLKNFCLVEFDTVEEALVCRKAFTSDEEASQRKLRLGDRDLEVNILIGSKVMRPFEANITPLGASLMYGQSNYLAMQTMRGQQMMGHPAAAMSQAGQSLGMMGSQGVSFQQPKNINDEIRMIFDDDHIRAMREKDIVRDNFSIAPCTQEFGEEPVDENLIMETESIEPLQPTQVEPFTEETIPKMIENKYQLFWSGFITRSGKNNFGVDGYFLTGNYDLAVEEVFDIKYHNLNVCHRTTIEEVLARPAQALVGLLCSNPTQRARFVEYRNYFKEKKAVGIVNHFRRKILYLFPYFEELKSILGPLRDGMYLIGMVTEIQKKEDTKPNINASEPLTQTDKGQESASEITEVLNLPSDMNTPMSRIDVEVQLQSTSGSEMLLEDTQSTKPKSGDLMDEEVVVKHNFTKDTHYPEVIVSEEIIDESTSSSEVEDMNPSLPPPSKRTKRVSPANKAEEAALDEEVVEIETFSAPTKMIEEEINLEEDSAVTETLIEEADTPHHADLQHHHVPANNHEHGRVEVLAMENKDDTKDDDANLEQAHEDNSSKTMSIENQAAEIPEPGTPTKSVRDAGEGQGSQSLLQKAAEEGYETNHRLTETRASLSEERQERVSDANDSAPRRSTRNKGKGRR